MITLLLALLATPALAQDDGFDAHGFTAVPADNDLDDFLEVWRVEPQKPGAVGISGLFEYADSPLVLVTIDYNGTETRETLLDNLFGLNLGAHVGLHERVGVALSAPVWFTSTGTDGGQGFGMGDMRLHVPIGIVIGEDQGRTGFGVGLVPFFDVPIGSEGKFLGNGGAGGGGTVMASYGTGGLLMSANAGMQVNPSMAYENLNGGTRLNLGLAGGYRLSETVATRLELTLEPSLTKNTYTLTESPGEATLSFRGRYPGGFSWTGGAATAYTRGASAAAFRLFAGVGYAFNKDEPLDRDGDGIVDKADACIDQPEVVNGYRDNDGCPDELGNVVVLVRAPDGSALANAPISVDGEPVARTDAEGRVRMSDLMPGSALSVHAGPADPDAGMYAPAPIAVDVIEGETTAVIDLVYLPGRLTVRATYDDAPMDATVSFRGPQEHPDMALGDDGEQRTVLVPGSWDVFVQAPAMALEHRTITVPPDGDALIELVIALHDAVVQTTAEEVVLLQSVEFEFDKAVIQAESEALLQEVSTNLIRFDDVLRVEVQGHTDSRGSDRYNVDLSQRRVDAVMARVVELGVAPDRLVAVGYGEDCAIDTNATDDGRARNRRVQFIILDPAPEDGIPCHDGVPARRATPRTFTREVTVPAE